MTAPDAAPIAAIQPGRSCPLHYRYAPSALSGPADFEASVLYIAGGLYGNVYALEALLGLVHAEADRAALVFNGDFHWFDATPPDFTVIDKIVTSHTALRGNVETEIASEDEATGCGCAYPPEVSDGEVERSNRIMARLRSVAREAGISRFHLATLPMHLVATVDGMRVGIVHGDAESLAGWSYSTASLSQPEAVLNLERHFSAADVRVIASTHTCLPVAIRLDTALGPCALFNNGAAGMPNFHGTRYGVVTRIATRRSREALYSTRIGSLHIEAIAVHYDASAWTQWFLETWPPGSPAHESYFQRIVDGPAYPLEKAVRSGIVPHVGRSRHASRRTH